MDCHTENRVAKCKWTVPRMIPKLNFVSLDQTAADEGAGRSYVVGRARQALIQSPIQSIA